MYRNDDILEVADQVTYAFQLICRHDKESTGFRSIFTFLAVNFLCSCGNTGNFSIEGTVKNKNQGKDGYTAYIVGVDKKLYTAVVSRVNIANTLEYQEIAIGDEVKV